MGNLTDYLDNYDFEAGSDADLNTVFADIRNHHSADIEIPTAKIAELEATNAELTAALGAAKAANWDLLQSVQQTPTPGDDTGTAGEDDPSDEITPEDFFK